MVDLVVGIVCIVKGQLETFEEVMLEVEEFLVNVVGVLVKFVEGIDQEIVLGLLLVHLHK